MLGRRMSASTSATERPAEAAAAARFQATVVLPSRLREEVTSTLEIGRSPAKRRLAWSIRKASAISGGSSENGLARFSLRCRGTVVSTGAE
jgi:hypothetical protein